MPILLTITAMTATMFPFGYGIFTFEMIGPQFRSLVSSFDGISNLSFLLGKWWHFLNLLFLLVAILATTCLRGIAFRVVSVLISFFFYLCLKEVKGLIHVS